MNHPQASPLSLELIIFDWDGTLIDSTAHIVRTINAAFAEHHFPHPAREEAEYIIGLSFYQGILKLTPFLNEMDRRNLIDAYQHHYINDVEAVQLFEHVLEGIALLKKQGVLLAIATGKSRSGLDIALDRTGLSHLFDATRTADECISKPHPDMVLSLLREFGIAKTRAIMVGDTTHDLIMAKNAGIPSVGVSYGAHKIEALRPCSPLAIFDTFLTLQDWLLQNLAISPLSSKR